MKKILLKTTTLLLLAMLWASTALMAQNMNRYITLTVVDGADIQLMLAADADDTPIQIVSGNNIYDITVGADWTNLNNYTTGSTTMTIYGNIKKLYCSDNGANITALDASHNTALQELWCFNNKLSSINVSNNAALEILKCSDNQLSSLDVSNNATLRGLNCSDNQISNLDISNNPVLEELYCSDNQISSLDVSNNAALVGLLCYNNPFTTQSIDNIYCALADRTASTVGNMYIANNASDANHADILESNAQNARDKNWEVWYFDYDANTGEGPLHDTDIPTNGNYVCGGSPNMDRYITLTVVDGVDIGLDLAANADNTPIQIVSGNNIYDITVGTDWTNLNNYTTGSTTMTIYGNIKKFRCFNNTTKLTGLDASHNTALAYLDCSNNQLSSLDVSNNVALWGLSCSDNQLNSLDVSNNPDLLGLNCSNNQISSLDISNNTALRGLDCSDNQISSLDISNNPVLEELSCSDNEISSLDVSNNAALVELLCYNNPFTTQTIDDIYCALVDRTASTAGKIYLANNASDANHADILESNAQNARDKNWEVWYDDYNSNTGGVGPLHNTDIPTNGNHICGGSPNMDSYITLTVVDGVDIGLDLAANADNTPIQIVSGNNIYDITVGTDWTNLNNYTTGSTTMTIYGNIKKFRCFNNTTKLTGLDASHNTALEYLDCSNNQLSSLDVSNNVALWGLSCSDNQLNSLDVSNNPDLLGLNCSNNQLSSLDISNNTALLGLNCSGNRLSNIDVSNHLNLQKLKCYKNPLTTQAINDIYCALVDRAVLPLGKMYLANNTSDANHADILESNAQNARDKNWKVWYDDGDSGALHDTDIPTTGTYVCGTVTVTGVSLDQSNISLVEGTTQKLTANIMPANATNQTVTWSSSHNNVATVDANGLVSAVAVGNATITVTTNDGGFTATCNVEVTASAIAVTGVSLDQSNISLVESTSQQLTANIMPANATNQNITWSSSDNNVATVDVNGLVSAVAVGNATITVTTDDGGFTATCNVEVTASAIAVTGVSLDQSNISLVEGTTQKLTANIMPANATNQTVTWSSSDNNVATVDVNGLVSAVAVGNATITVTTDDGGFTATCNIEVTASAIAVTGVSVSPTAVSLKPGQTVQLTATVSPANATNQNVTWSSQNESVATVDENGVVTGVALNGKTTITVTTEDGDFTAVCQVEAYDAIEEPSLSNIAKVYPNPVYETLYIEPQTTREFTVELYNTHGQLVLQSQNNTTISVVDLPKGVYMLKLMIDKQVYSTKVVK